MTWSSWADFWAMGGYGLYVWGSLGVCLVALASEVLLLDHKRRALIQTIRNNDTADARESSL